MKTLSITSLHWIKAFFTASGPVTKSQPALYKRSAAAHNNKFLDEQEHQPADKTNQPVVGDLMRTAHRGNFSSGPTFLFHPGWFK